MISRFAIVCLSALFLVNGWTAATDAPQSEAERLLDRARQLSDIRKPDSHPFRLKATFSFVGENLDTFEGTYTELWVSDSQWRREISVGNLRKVEVGTPTRIWVLGGGTALPEQANRISRALMIFPPKSTKFEFESVTKIRPDDSSTRCAVTKPNGERKAKHAFCFDQQNGLLVENIAPEYIRERVADYSCGFDKFTKFGDQWFPNEIDCLLNGHRQLDVHVVDLATDVFRDPTLFTPPNGAIEIGRCSTGAMRPKAVSTPDPMFPAGERGHSAMVGVRLIVDAEGKPQNVEVSRSGGKAFDEMAIGTVRRWRFKPATCNGDPMPLQIEIEVTFRSFQ